MTRIRLLYNVLLYFQLMSTYLQFPRHAGFFQAWIARIQLPSGPTAGK